MPGASFREMLSSSPRLCPDSSLFWSSIPASSRGVSMSPVLRRSLVRCSCRRRSLRVLDRPGYNRSVRLDKNQWRSAERSRQHDAAERFRRNGCHPVRHANRKRLGYLDHCFWGWGAQRRHCGDRRDGKRARDLHYRTDRRPSLHQSELGQRPVYQFRRYDHRELTLTRARALAGRLFRLVDVAVLVSRDDDEGRVGAVLHSFAKWGDDFYVIQRHAVSGTN